jgi:phage terminase large subunit-like protein
MDPRRALEELAGRRANRKLFNNYAKPFDHSQPAGPDNVGVYQWQIEFHNAGAKFAERCLMAANQVGKTLCGGAETAIHLTGEYPPWWQGRRFDHPVKWWTGAERTEDSKDLIQAELLGAQGEHGTGWIPKTRIVNATYRQAGVPEVVDKIYVRHKSGGTSECTLKTYQMEAKGWRGKTLDGVWLDEECNQDIFDECLTRVLVKKGIIMKTVTPVLGVSGVVRHFVEGGPGIYLRNVTWDDAPHLDEEEKERLWASYPPHVRETRSKGVPMLGTGAVYPVSDDDIIIPYFPLPQHYYRINGLDFGIDHPAAGAFCALDRDTDTFYVYDVYRQSGQTAIYHAAALKKHGIWVPNAWPHDGMQRDKGSGIALKDHYRKQGLYMLKDHAQYEQKDKGNHVEPGVIEMLEYMRTGRFKVFATCAQWFEEKRLYHRKDGQIVKQYDDLMDATRYAFMMRRYAKVKPPDTSRKRKFSGPIVGGRAWRG